MQRSGNQKKCRGYYPRTPSAEGADPLPYTPPARPSCVRVRCATDRQGKGNLVKGTHPEFFSERPVCIAIILIVV